MNLEGFEKNELPGLLEWGRKIPRGPSKKRKFPEHDQLWMNRFYANPTAWTKRNALLPPFWNWKVYWRFGEEQGNISDRVFLVHFHGPKPGVGVDEMARCDADRAPRKDDGDGKNGSDNTTSIDILPEPYHILVQHAICCDQGRTARLVVNMYRRWKAMAVDTIHEENKTTASFM